jgi:hypothetical protein
MDFDFFRQFKPKSMKEILEESKEKWRSKIKEFAGKQPNFPWVVSVHVEERDSPEFTLDQATNEGYDIRSYKVYLDERECDITMTGATHDRFYLHEGGGKIRLGDGNDSVDQVYLDRHGQRIESSASYQIFGGDGNDVLVGTSGRNRRRSDPGCYLNGGHHDDVLESRNIGDKLVGDAHSDHLIADWYSDAIMTGGSEDGDYSLGNRDGDNIFEIQVLGGVGRNGEKTITDFDQNDKIRFANETDSALDLRHGSNRGEFEVVQNDRLIATIHTSEDLFMIREGGRAGEDLIFTGRTHWNQQVEYAF